MKNFTKNRLAIALIGAFLLVAFFFFTVLNEENELEVVFFDVGQGSSIFIETPQRFQILIDGGPDEFLILEYLSQEMPFWDRSIDMIIVTHSSADHLTGLIEVLERYKIDRIVWTGMEADTLIHQEFKQQLIKAEKQGTEIIVVQLGQKIEIDNAEIYLKILNPLTNMDAKSPNNQNNDSIVARLAYDEISFLFTSDIEKRRELLLIDKQENLGQELLDVDILKIPHHGSKTSSSSEFLQAVRPSTAIIQVGEDNRFNHPHQEAIERIEEEEINLFRTDFNGTIRIISDGKSYQTKVEK